MIGFEAYPLLSEEEALRLAREGHTNACDAYDMAVELGDTESTQIFAEQKEECWVALDSLLV